MAVTPFGSGRLDKDLDIIFTKQVNYAAASTHPEWDMVLSKLKASTNLGRSVRYRIETELGYAAAGAPRSPGAIYVFPKGQTSKLDEFEANYKERVTTVSLSASLYKQAQAAKDSKAYEPLAREQSNKAIAEARLMSAEFYLDGTGVRATASSVSDAAIASSRVTVTLTDTDSARGNASCCEVGDILVSYAAAGTAVVPTGGAAASYYGYKVLDRNRAAQTIVLQPVDSSFNAIVVTASNIVATNVFYRKSQEDDSIPNLGSITDYGAASNIYAGLESLSASDGRVVNGMTMQDSLKGTRVDCATQELDAIFIDQWLGEAYNRMGAGRFKYTQMVSDDFARRQLIESREADRRFTSMEDNKRGTTYFAYQYENAALRLVVSEYARRRVWFLPEMGSGEKVLEWHGTPWESFTPQGQSGMMFAIDQASGRHTNEMVSFRKNTGVMINRAPGAIGCLHNYTLSV